MCCLSHQWKRRVHFWCFTKYFGNPAATTTTTTFPFVFTSETRNAVKSAITIDIATFFGSSRDNSDRGECPNTEVGGKRRKVFKCMAHAHLHDRTCVCTAGSAERWGVTSVINWEENVSRRPAQGNVWKISLSLKRVAQLCLNYAWRVFGLLIGL